jgi:hypothetical protein
MGSKKRFTSFVIITILTGLFSSCNVFDPASPTASYIHIDSISLQTVYSSQGSNSGKIIDAWVLYNNEYLGTFPLPADIPLIGDGEHNIKIKGGIIENGIAGSRSAYVKFTTFDTTLTLSTNKKTYLNPKVTYNPATTFAQLEDFDDASLTLVTSSNGNVPLLISSLSDTNSFESNSGVATLDENHQVFEVASSAPFALPISLPSYLELNYKCEQDFEVGMYISTSTNVVKSPMLTIRASSAWKKIYVNISNLGGVTPDGIAYKVYLHADKPLTLTTTNLYFDNLKVVY